LYREAFKDKPIKKDPPKNRNNVNVSKSPASFLERQQRYYLNSENNLQKMRIKKTIQEEIEVKQFKDPKIKRGRELQNSSVTEHLYSDAFIRIEHQQVVENEQISSIKQAASMAVISKESNTISLRMRNKIAEWMFSRLSNSLPTISAETIDIDSIDVEELEIICPFLIEIESLRLDLDNSHFCSGFVTFFDVHMS